MPKKLFLIDGSALYYRSYFAFIRNPLINSKGENTSATFGFLSSLIKLIEEEHPDYLAVIFDTKEPTFRHEIYPEYKATREKMPEEMAEQYPRLVDTLKRLNFVVMDREGYEADDIIGSLAKKFASPGLNVYIVSGDKDMAQLVNNHVFLYYPGRGNKPAEILDAAAVKEKMGIEPGQIVDWLALMGDSSDNIPGVPKVGNITAVKLLKEFGSIDKLYESLDRLKEGSIKSNLIACQDQTGLAKQLATIHADMDFDVKLDDLKFRIWNADEAEKVMNELEFRRLADRMKAIARGDGALEELSHHDESAVRYELVDTLDSVKKLARQLERQKAFVFDLETDS
ncbi:MAG TPA: DNA polymerase I, partial [Calditrichaeota bacterium]|nr:DNA polymerase I [Calditrichota bacterium]